MTPSGSSSPTLLPVQRRNRTTPKKMAGGRSPVGFGTVLAGGAAAHRVSDSRSHSGREKGGKDNHFVRSYEYSHSQRRKSRASGS
jgi:hypothetical protein